MCSKKAFNTNGPTNWATKKLHEIELFRNETTIKTTSDKATWNKADPTIWNRVPSL